MSVNIPNIALNNTRHSDKRCALPFTSNWQNWRLCAESCLILSKLIEFQVSEQMKHQVWWSTITFVFQADCLRKKILWILHCINYIFLSLLPPSLLLKVIINYSALSCLWLNGFLLLIFTISSCQYLNTTLSPHITFQQVTNNSL